MLTGIVDEDFEQVYCITDCFTIIRMEEGMVFHIIYIYIYIYIFIKSKTIHITIS